MKIICCLLCLVLVTGFLNRASAQDYKMAIGLRLSTTPPTIGNSVSFKYFLNERSAIEALVSYYERFGIGGLYEQHQLIGATPGLNWFYGGGGYVGFQYGLVYAGPMGVVGIDYKFSNAPINLTLDWKPELDIAPAINFVAGALALTVRFTLK